jgi:hypothetical protein
MLGIVSTLLPDYTASNAKRVQFIFRFGVCYVVVCGPGSSGGIATVCGLDGRGIESWWVRDFPHLSRPALGPHPASCIMGTGSFPGAKSGRGVTLTPHPLILPRSKINRVDLCLYGPSWPVKRVKLTYVVVRFTAFRDDRIS